MKILVTGASGVLGRAVVGALDAAGHAVRQGLRDPAKGREGVESVRFDYADASTFGPALSGVRGVVLIAPPLDAQAPAKLGPAIVAAKDAGVEHVVFVSAFGANHNEQSPLRIVERLLMDSGIGFTILRPNFFMENFTRGAALEAIRRDNAIFVAAGDGKTSFISARDIAATAVAAFEKSLVGGEFDLTGPEALDHSEVAAAISGVSGRSVQYHALPDEEMTKGLRASGMPDAAIAYLSMLYGIVRAGYAEAVTNDVERVTGRRAMDFRTFAELSAGDWK